PATSTSSFEKRPDSHRLAQECTGFFLDHSCIRCFGLRTPTQHGAPSGGILKVESGAAPVTWRHAMRSGGPGNQSPGTFELTRFQREDAAVRAAINPRKLGRFFRERNQRGIFK